MFDEINVYGKFSNKVHLVMQTDRDARRIRKLPQLEVTLSIMTARFATKLNVN